MSNEVNKTALQYATVDYMEQRAIESAATQKVFRPVLGNPNTVFDFTGPGKQKLVVQRPAVTFAALTEWDGTGNSTNHAFAPTQRALLPVLVGCHMQMGWEADTMAEIDPINMIADEAAIAWATAEDSASTISYAALYTESNTDLGSAVALDYTLVRQGAQTLMTAKARQPYNLFIDPIQWAHLMTDSTSMQLLKENGTQPAGFSSTEGVRMDQFVGRMFGCNIWCVPGGMITSTTLKAMMVGQNAIGLAYKKISTPLSPTPSKLNIDVDWNAQHRYYTVALSTCYDVGGIVNGSTTNKWIVEIATKTTA